MLEDSIGTDPLASRSQCPAMPVVIHDEPYGTHGLDTRPLQKLVLSSARSAFGLKKVVNSHSGDVITLAIGGIKHTVNGAQLRLLNTLAHLPDLIESAQKTGVVMDKFSRADIVAVHKYEVDVLCLGEVLQASIVVREAHHGVLNFYDLAFLLV